MHNASQIPALTIGGTVLKESDDLVILGATFDSKMTFENHLCCVSRAASQWLGILRKSWQLFHDRLLLGRCFRGFVLPVLEYCSAIWCSAAADLRLLDHVVSGASFLTGGVFECDLSHRRSVAVLCMLYKSGVTWCTLFMVLFLCRMCQCGLHAVLWLHIGTLMLLLAAEPLSIAGQLFAGQCLCGTILVTPCSMVWDWQVARAWPMSFYWPSCLLIFCLLLFSLSLLLFSGLVLWDWGFWTDRVLTAFSQPCIANLF